MTTNTRPVANIQSRLVDKGGFLIAPWIQFFQQFTQKAATIIDISTLSPYTANQIGTIIVLAGANIQLIRGSITINLVDGQVIVPIAIGDTIIWTAGTVKFLGS